MTASHDSLLIANATLIDGSGGPPVPHAAVLIEGERIAYAGPRVGLGPQPAARVVDGRQRWVMPGLIDLHTHSTSDADMRVYLLNGVTSIRFAGRDHASVVRLRERIERGDIPGPRIFSCGPMLDMTPASFPHWTWEVNSPAEATVAAQHLLTVDRVEALIVTQRITSELLVSIVEAAHDSGVPVVGQIWAIDASQAAEIGIDQLDNNSRILASRQYPPERLLRWHTIAERLTLLARAWVAVDWDLTRPMMEAMIEHRVAFCPTLVTTRARVGLGMAELEADPQYASEYGPAERADWAAFQHYVGGAGAARDETIMRAALERRQEWMQRFHALGGTLLLGTDMHFGGIMIHQELRHLAAAGLSALETINAATELAATRLGMAQTLGTVRAGKVADLLVLNRDPLQDLGAVRDVALVIKAGQVVVGPS